MAPRLIDLTAVSAAVIACRRCPQLVAYREQVAREKRAAFAAEDYWGRPLPGFGDVEALDVLQRLPEMCLFSSDYPHAEGGRDPLGRFDRSLDGLPPDMVDGFYATNALEWLG